MTDEYSYKFGNVTYDLNSRTFVSGILNVTPDSFSDGGSFLKPEDALSRAKEMEAEGADFIDVGGQSTRPGSEEIPVEEELSRVIPVIKLLKKEIKVPISVDTYRSEVADEALGHGAVIVNDISAFNYDSEMPAAIVKHKASAVCMHIKGRPKDMQADPHYNNLMGEVLLYFEKAIWKANLSGIDQMIIDPGIGFGKTVEHNLLLIRNMNELKKLDCPIMIGVSRKSLIGKILGGESDDRLEGTIALNVLSIINGVNILRVHDVKAGVRTAKIIDTYKKLK